MFDKLCDLCSLVAEDINKQKNQIVVWEENSFFWVEFLILGSLEASRPQSLEGVFFKASQQQKYFTCAFWYAK